MRRKQRLLLLFAIVMLAACSTGDGQRSSLPRPDAEMLKRSAYPVGKEWRQAYPWAEHTDLDQASFSLWQQGIEVCMQSKGFDYSEPPFVSATEFFTAVNPLNAAAAEVYGYHLPPDAGAPPGGATASGAFTVALYGVGGAGGGCSDRASNYAYGIDGFQSWADQQNQISTSVAEVLRTHQVSPDATEHIVAWVACMQTKGYHYETPDDPGMEFNDTPTVTEKELRVRKADMECDISVKLTESRSVAEAALVSNWVDEHATYVNDLSALGVSLLKEVATRSQRLLAEGVSVLTD